VLGDFIVSWTEPNTFTEGPAPESPWLLYSDGSWGNARAGASTIQLRYAARLQLTKETDKCTNDISEYEALVMELHKF
jgi:ribonuclease HI